MHGLLIQDYINYAPKNKETPLSDLIILFEKEALIELNGNSLQTRISHIQLSYDETTKTKQFGIAETLIAELGSGSLSFEELVLRYSDDFGSKDNEGDLGFTDGSIFPDEFENEINELTNNKGVDVILDMVAGNYIPRNLKCLNFDGRLLIIAVQGGIKDEVNFANIMIKRQTITGSTLRPQSSNKKSEYVESLVKNAWKYLESGKVKPIIEKEFDLMEVVEAHKALEKGDHVGKFIMRVSQ